VPDDQLPTYAKGQHLRGIDATIVDRVSAEMVSAMQHLLNLACRLGPLSGVQGCKSCQIEASRRWAAASGLLNSDRLAGKL